MRDMKQLWAVRVKMTDGQEFLKEFSTSHTAMEFIEDIRQTKKNAYVFDTSTTSPHEPCLYINPKQVTSIRLERIL